LLLALTTRDPVAAIVGVLILYIAVQQLENAVLVPKIQGDAVELHPSLVIFVLIIGGAIGGLLGAILAIPITAAARDVYRYLFRRAGNDEDASAPPADRGPPETPGPAETVPAEHGPAPATVRRKRRRPAAEDAS
jgi:predicted PurR-regulated permease PerM